ncbi:uncharacterized protein LOC127875349 [Dreissena polymorpha]|uniref:Uncharacterized protein n=1 Tax=Dreissena polymorpha TaxID=45954 RepID=A0A9D4L7Y0_DREPO|nr:uncharacterized protein LOC127875349 [Dreissena polymorpha]KAH3853702.1 hypothetical protein DPMN_096234 [Dreissena polymorpha]
MATSSDDYESPTRIADTLLDVHAKLDNTLEMAYLSALNNPVIEQEIRAIAREALEIERSTCTMMQMLNEIARHVETTLLQIVQDGLAWKNQELTKSAFEKIEQYAEEMAKETLNSKNRFKIFVEKIEGQVVIIKKKELDQDNRKNKTEKAVETETKALKRSKLLREDMFKQEYERVVATRGEAIEAIWLDSCVSVSALVAIFANPVFGGAALTYFVGRTVHAKWQARSVSKRKADERKAIVELDERIQTREQEIRREKDTEWGEEQKCLELALGYARCLEESNSAMQTFWSTMKFSLEGKKNDMAAWKIYIEKMEDEKYYKRLHEAVENAKKDWKVILEICRNYNEDKANRTMYHFLSVNHASITSDRLENRKKELKEILEPDASETTN